jgi:hypothetical protein
MTECALNQWGVQQHRQSTNQLAHHLSCAHFLSIKSFVITSKGRAKERKKNQQHIPEGQAGPCVIPT